LALAQHVDDVVLTGAVGTTSRHDLQVVKRRLDAVGAHLLGLVLIESGGGHRVARTAKPKRPRRTKARTVDARAESRPVASQPEPAESELDIDTEDMEAVADPDVGLSRRVGPTK
jgi:hypothetical protein